MNFEPEIALFQASFYCPEIENGLAEHDEYITTEAGKRRRGKVNITAVCHAVREIIHGLEGERTEAEKCHWNFKLHAILFCKLLERRRKKEENAAEEKSWSEDCNDCLLEYFEGVSRALPNDVDLSLYLDVANTFKWGQLCAQVLCSLDYKMAAELLEEIVAECIKMNSLNLLVFILISSLMPSPRDRGNSSTRKRPEIGDKNIHSQTRLKSTNTSESPTAFHRHVISSCEQICKLQSKIQIKNLRFHVIQALAVCLNNLTSELKLKDGNHDVKFHSDNSNYCESITAVAQKHRQNDPNFSSAIYKLHLLCLSDSRNCTGVFDQWDTMSHEPQRNCDEDDAQSLEKRELACVAVTKIVYTLHCLLTVDWEDFFVDKCNTNTPDPEDFRSLLKDKEVNQDVLLACLATDVCNILNRVARYFGQNLQLPVTEQTLNDIELMKRQCSEVEAHLSQVLDEDVLLAEKLTVAMEMDREANEQREHMWLLEAIRRVDERLEGYEDDLGQLLSASNQWEEDSWMECLERNITALAVPRFTEQLIGVAMAMDERKLASDVIQRVLKVLLASYSTLPFPLQNKLRDRLWSYPAGVSVFARHDAGGFERESTSAFNRLVSLARGQENTEVLTAVSCLALQCPVKTLRLGVSRAVSNAAVCQAVCQVLQAMPSLATFQQRADNWPLLCHLIQDAMATLATTPSEEANLLQLVTVLLQPFKPFLDPQCPFWMPPVLPAEAFAQLCILPNLRTDTTATDNRSHLIMVLKFLKEVVNLQETRTQISNTSVFGTSAFPIMLCLCQLLDSGRVLWGGVVTTTPKAEVKEAVQGLLGRMGRIAMTMPGDAERERGISWLINRVASTLHWSTTLTLQESLPDCLQHQKRLMPESIINMCSLPDSEWSATPSNKNPQKAISLCDHMIELLLCCRVSDRLANILSESILLPEGTSNDSFLEALTLALVQVLPQSIMGEWQCIMGMLAQLLTSGVLWIPYSARYVTELPMVNIGDFRVHLGQSQLLLSVMQVLMSPCCQDWATPPLLHHVTRCYVGTMQQLLSQISTSDLSDQPGCLFVIGQFFCHACDVLGSLPTDELKEQVFVLTLEYLSQMEEITCSDFSKLQLRFERTNQIEVLGILANQKVDGDQRRTLLQKISGLTQGN
ncbi:gem-associated protein 4-like [Patiria miniata]|uniref:Uncharacterized protein n=1 Tax=Patiria miniata TaxID=46514 RepID=A0A913Z3V0_PATMI|nr:gem-associated protein 4-like [Patiria miniata]